MRIVPGSQAWQTAEIVYGLNKVAYALNLTQTPIKLSFNSIGLFVGHWLFCTIYFHLWYMSGGSV
jgi:hypothetical protein